MPGASPLFNYTQLGIGIEGAGYAVPQAPTIWVSGVDVDFHGSNAWDERGSNRGNIGMEEPQPADYPCTGAFTIEADPDTIGAWCALAHGTEAVTANANNPATLFTGTLTPAITMPGIQTVAIATVTGTIVVNNWYRFEPGTNEEWVQAATGSTATSFVGQFTRTHPAGATINAGVLAYDHTYTWGIPRKSFTAEWYRRVDTIRAVGNKIGSMEWIFAPRALVQCRFATTYQTDGNVAVPGVASFGALKPFRFIDPLNTVTIAGVTPTAGMLSGNVSTNSGLQPGEVTYGGGRLITTISEGPSRVTASLVFQFSDQQFTQRVWGALGATGPLADISGVPIVISQYSRSQVNQAVPYRVQLQMPNCKISMGPTAGRSGSTMSQTLTIICAQSAPFAQDDLKVVVTNASSSPT